MLAVFCAQTAYAADPVAGLAVFKTQCGICHSVVQGKNMVGPSLFGVVGRCILDFASSAASASASALSLSLVREGPAEKCSFEA